MAAPNLTMGADSLHHRLRDDIIFGRLEPRRKLRLERLRDDYDASVTSLREVMSRLQAEGLLTFEPQKGFEVSPISAQDLKEISDMRILLECHAVTLSFNQGDLEWEGHLVGAHHKLSRLEGFMLAGDRSVTEQWKAYDRAFHVALISACGSPELMAAHQRIFDRFLRYQVLLVLFRGQAAAREHDALLAAALQRDVAKAQEILRQHINACLSFTLDNRLLGSDTDE